MARPLLPIALASVLVAHGAGLALAQSGAAASTTQLDPYSAYERESLRAALAAYHTTVDPAPEGKTLEGIDVVTLDVIEPRDPVPNFIDIFHATTKKYVVAREVLLTEGEPYRQSLVDDTLRRLRVLPQLSLVLAVPTRGHDAAHVRLLVITKDVWSLRLNWDIQAGNGGLTYLTLQPSETNLAGTQNAAALNFTLDPAALALGASYVNYRLDGSRIEFAPSANVLVNRGTGSTEGSYGGLTVGQPLYSPRTEWAWDATATWADDVQRNFENAAVKLYLDPSTKQSVPFAYRQRVYTTQYTLTRSFGWATKHDVTVGASLARSEYLPGTSPSANVSARSIDDFVAAYVPTSNARVGPFFQYHTYSKQYVRLLDFETLGLQEDFRLGPEAFVNVYPVTTALGSTRSFVGFDASALYTVRLGDGLARATVESITEAESSSLSDASVDTSVHLVSPTAVLGRFVFDAHLLYRYRNSLNQITYLGGDTRLRGYPTQFFPGADEVNSNLEFRTRSIDVLTAQLGLVGFCDVGDAFNGFSELRPYESLGVGARILFPQLDRVVFRADLAFPLADGARLPGVGPVGFFLAFGQSFGAPTIAPGGAPGSTQLTGSPTTALSPPP